MSSAVRSKKRKSGVSGSAIEFSSVVHLSWRNRTVSDIARIFFPLLCRISRLFGYLGLLPGFSPRRMAEKDTSLLSTALRPATIRSWMPPRL